MNLTEYIKLKKMEIQRFIRGINFKNIGLKDKGIINVNNEEFNNFFNKNEDYRKITEEFLIKISGLCRNMIDTELEFASSNESIDNAMQKFNIDIMSAFEDYKNRILRKNLELTKSSDSKKIKNVYLINTDLSFIKINLTNPDLEGKNEVSNILELLYAVYNLIWMIEDKKSKLSNLLDVTSSSFKVNTPEYTEMFSHWTQLFQEKDYEKFNNTYNELIEKIENKKTR